MSDNHKMERGLAQILHNYNEGNVFDFGHYGVNMKVAEWDSATRLNRDQITIDDDRVAEVIRNKASRFRNGEEWEDLDSNSIQLFTPGNVEGSLYPLVFYCENPACRRVYTAGKPQYLRSTYGTCNECNSKLTQLTFLNFCDCGKLAEPRPNRECDNQDHGYDYVKLEKNPGGPTQWRFVCDKCGQDLGGLGTTCSACGQSMQGPSPSGTGRTFYSQSEVIVEIPLVGDDADNVPRGEPWARVLMADYIDEIDLAEETLEEIAASEGLEERRRELIEEDGIPPENVDKMMERMGMSGSDRDTAARATDHIIPPEEDFDPDGLEGAYANIANELFTFLRSTRGYEGNQEDIADVRHPKPTEMDCLLSKQKFKDAHPDSIRYRPQLTESHITQSWVVDQFPLLDILFGYSRADPQASKTSLREFSNPNGEPQTPVFVNTSPSEAIIFEIDRAAVINWLEANDIGNNYPPRDDEAAMKSWLLSNVATTQLENPFKDIDHEVTEWVYTLIHSISHCLLSTAGEQCGLATDSIHELTLPSIPAIILYAESTESFALGSMFTLFKTRMYPWMEDARNLAKQCLLDPACSQNPEGAACHACLHVNPVSGEYMNKQLDRRYLVGDAMDGIVGFWGSEIQNNIK